MRKARNVHILLGEVSGFDPVARRVQLSDGAQLEYDYLIVAAGARHAYFGHDEWERDAPGLKTIEDAVEIRRRLLFAFEKAERETYLTGRRTTLTVAVIGGGPTGVELAGAIADLARLSWDVLINATPAGSVAFPDQSPLPAKLHRPNTVVLDMVYEPLDTRLLRDAQQAGCTIVDGLEMLLAQAVAQFEKASKNAENPKIKEFATKTLPTLKEHLDIAKKLGKGAGAGAAASAPARP